MKFKDDTVRAGWSDPSLKSDVKAITYAVIGYCLEQYPHLEAIITAVHYESGQFNSVSQTHPEGRAVDVSLHQSIAVDVLVFGDKGVKMDEAMMRVTDWINANFSTNIEGMKVGVYHTTGYGWHIHIQVPRHGNVTILRRN